MEKRNKVFLRFLLIFLVVTVAFSLLACEDKESDGESPIESLVITTLPKINYYRGDAFDASGATLTVYYENGKTESVPLTMNMISDFNSNAVGKQVLTVTFKNATTYLTVNVSSAPVYSVRVYTMPDKTTYIIGEEMDVTGMQLLVTFSNNLTEVVDVTPDMVSAFSTENEGETEMSILYSGKYCTAPYIVEKKKTVNIQTVLGSDFRVMYVVGDTFDLAGGSFFVAYNDNTSETLDWRDLHAKGKLSFVIDKEEANVFTSSALQRTVTILYEGVKYQILVAVSELRPQKAAIVSFPKDQVMMGTTDLTGAQVFVEYNSALSGYTPRLTIATDEAKATYDNGAWQGGYTRFFRERNGGFEQATASFDPNIDYYVSSEEVFADVFFTRAPYMYVKKNGAFVPAAAPYANGVVYYLASNTKILDFSDSLVSISWNDFDINTVKEYSIGVTVGEISVDCPIRVVAPTPRQLEVYPSSDYVHHDADSYYVYQDEAVDITKWTYQIKLNNDLYMVISSTGSYSAAVTENMYAGNVAFSNHKTGTYQYAFSYTVSSTGTTLTCSVPIEVRARKIVALDITAPTRKVFSVGDTIDLTGGELTAKYNNGEVVAQIVIDKTMLIDESGNGLTSLDTITQKEGDKEVFVRYYDSFYDTYFDASFTVKVIAKALAIELNDNIVTKNDYILGTAFSTENWEVFVTYSDGTTSSPIRDFSGEEWSFENTDFSAIGKYTVKLYYGDKSDGISLSYECSVHNEIASLSLNKTSIGNTTEGMEFDFDGVILTITRENGETEKKNVTSSMITDYHKAGLFDPTETSNNIVTMKVTCDGRPETVECPEIVSTVVGRKLISVGFQTAPRKEYTKNDEAFDFSETEFLLGFDNGTVVVLRKNDFAADYSFSLGEISGYSFATGYYDGASDFVGYSFDNMKTDLMGQTEEEFVTKDIVFLFTDGNYTDNAIVTDPLRFYCFKKQAIALSVVIGTATTGSEVITAVEEFADQKVYLNEGLKFYSVSDGVYDFPGSDSSVGRYVNTGAGRSAYDNCFFVKVTYDDMAQEYLPLERIAASSGFSIDGYSETKTGMQSVTIGYMLCECTFAVYSNPNIIDAIEVVNSKGESVSAITVVEGMSIDRNLYSVSATLKDADGNPVATKKVIDFSDVTVNCAYIPGQTITFSQRRTDNRYYKDFSATVSYDGCESDVFSLTVLKKKATTITMKRMPQQIYPESVTATELNLNDEYGNKGLVLVLYDNNTTDEFEMDNAKIEITKTGFKTNIVLENGAQQVQTVFVRYTDENNVSVETSYNVVVCDRRYLSVAFEDENVFSEKVFYCQYGTGMEAGPQYKVYYYTEFTAKDPTEFDGYTLRYKNIETGVYQDEWPVEVGRYTMCFTYDGDETNNEFEFSDRFIEVTKRSIGIVMSDVNVVYGEKFSSDDENDVLSLRALFGQENDSWRMSGVIGNILTGEPYVYGDTDVVTVSFDVYNARNEKVAFIISDDRKYLIINANVGTYTVVPKITINPKIVNDVEFFNYVVSTDIGLNGCKLTIAQKPISIEAVAANKIYGEGDPVFTFRVKDENGGFLGGNYYNALTEGTDYTVGSEIGKNIYTYNAGSYLYEAASGLYAAATQYYELISHIALDDIFADKAVANYRLTRESGENVVDKHIIEANVFEGVLDNYILKEYTSATLSIHKASLTLTGVNTTRAYGTAALAFSIGLQAKKDNEMQNEDSFEAIFSKYFYDDGAVFYYNLTTKEVTTVLPVGEYYDRWAVLYRNVVIEGMDTVVYNDAVYSVLPIATGCGTYRCTVDEDIFGAIPNYSVTTQGFSFTITPVAVEMNVGSVIVYEDTSVTDGNGNLFVDYIDYSATGNDFNVKNFYGNDLTADDFVFSVADRSDIDSTYSDWIPRLLLGVSYLTGTDERYGLSSAYLVGCTFVKAVGTDTGLYRIMAEADYSPDFSDFSVVSRLQTQDGDIGFMSYYHRLFRSRYNGIAALSADYDVGAYVIVLPSFVDYRYYYGDTVGTMNEEYAGKSVADWPLGLTTKFSKDYSAYADYPSALSDAVRYGIVPKKGAADDVLNAGQYTGTIYYSFFADAIKPDKFSTDYIYLGNSAWIDGDIMAAIFNYILFGTIPNESITFEKAFDYTVRQRALSVIVESGELQYNFAEQTLITRVDGDKSSLIGNDRLSFTYSVEVVYNGRNRKETITTYKDNSAYTDRTTFTSAYYYSLIDMTGKDIPYIGDGNDYYERIADVSGLYIKTGYGAFELTGDVEYDETKTYYRLPTDESVVNPYSVTRDSVFATEKTYYLKDGDEYRRVEPIFEFSAGVMNVDSLDYVADTFVLTTDKTVRNDKKYYVRYDSSEYSGFSLANSGVYSVTLTGIGNDNYYLEETSPAYIRIVPNVIPVLLYPTGGSVNTDTTQFIFDSVYTGKEQQPFAGDGWTETVNTEKVTDLSVSLAGLVTAQTKKIGTVKHNNVTYDVFIKFLDDEITDISVSGSTITDENEHRTLLMDVDYVYYINYRNTETEIDGINGTNAFISYTTYKTVNSLIVSYYYDKNGVLQIPDPLSDSPNTLTIYADDGEGNYPVYVKREKDNLDKVVGYDVSYSINSDFVDYSVVFVYRKDGKYYECKDGYDYSFVIIPKTADLCSFYLVGEKTYDGKAASISDDDIGKLFVMDTLTADPITDYSKINFVFSRLAGEGSTKIGTYDLVSVGDQKSAGHFAVRAYYVNDYGYSLEKSDENHTYQINYELRFKGGTGNSDGVYIGAMTNTNGDAVAADGSVSQVKTEGDGCITIMPSYGEYFIYQSNVIFQLYANDNPYMNREYDGYGLTVSDNIGYSGSLKTLSQQAFYSGTIVDDYDAIFYKMTIGGYGDDFADFTDGTSVVANEIDTLRFNLDGTPTPYKTGYYGYTFNGVFFDALSGEHTFASVNASYGNWLSWNYKFTIRKVNKSVAFDGIYCMNARKVYIGIDGQMPTPDKTNYTYYIDYNGRGHSAADMNGFLAENSVVYVYRNDEFVPILSTALRDFYVPANPVVSSGNTITDVNVNESLDVGITSVLAQNPNFSVVNNNISIKIRPLEVEVMLTFVNTTDNNNTAVTYGKTLRENAISYTLSVTEEELAAFNKAMNDASYSADEMLQTIADFDLAEYYLYGYKDGSFGKLFTFRVMNNVPTVYLYNAQQDKYYEASAGVMTAGQTYYSRTSVSGTVGSAIDKTVYYEYHEWYERTADATISSGKKYYQMAAQLALSAFDGNTEYYEKTADTFTATKDTVPVSGKTYYIKSLVSLPVGTSITVDLYTFEQFFAKTDDVYFLSGKDYYTVRTASVSVGGNIEAGVYYNVSNGRYVLTEDRIFKNGTVYYTTAKASVKVGTRIERKLYVASGNDYVLSNDSAYQSGQQYFVFTADIRSEGNDVTECYYYFDGDRTFVQAETIDAGKSYFVVFEASSVEAGRNTLYFTGFERMEKANGTAGEGKTYYEIVTYVNGTDYFVGAVVAEDVYEKIGDCYYRTSDVVFAAGKTYYAFQEKSVSLGQPVSAYYEYRSGFEVAKEDFATVVKAEQGIDYEIYAPIPKGFYTKDDASGVYIAASGTFTRSGVYYRLKGYYGIRKQEFRYEKQADGSYVITQDETYGEKTYYRFEPVKTTVGFIVAENTYYECNATTGEMRLTADVNFENKTYYIVSAASVTVGAKTVSDYYVAQNGCYYLANEKYMHWGSEYYSFVEDMDIAVADAIRFYEKSGNNYVATSDMTAQANKKYYYFKQSSAKVLDYEYNQISSVNYTVGSPIGVGVYTLSGQTYLPATGNYLNGVTYYRRTSFSARYSDGSDLLDASVLPGTYYTAANDFGRNNNFSIKIVSTAFTVEKQVIHITGVERSYYSTDYVFITAEDTENTNEVNSILNGLLEKLTDLTNNYDGVGAYTIQLPEADILDYNSNPGNKYRIEYDGTARNGNITIPLYIRKLDVHIAVTVGSTTEYGITITQDRYEFITDAPEDNDGIGEQSNRAQDLRTFIRERTVDLTVVGSIISQTNYSGKVSSISLLYYLQNEYDVINAEFGNYNLVFGQLTYQIVKREIPIYVTVNKTYSSENGAFSILYSDRDKLYYSEGANDILSYGIMIDDFVSGGQSYHDPEEKIFEIINGIEKEGGKIKYKNVVYDTIPDMLKAITKYNLCRNRDGSGTDEIMAGRNYICLNDGWYSSDNYILKAATTPIIIYPEISSVGEYTANGNYHNLSADTEVAFSEKIVIDPVTKEISGLSFLLRLNVDGMKATLTVGQNPVDIDYSAQYFDTLIFNAYTGLTYEYNGEYRSYYDGIAYTRGLKMYFEGGGSDPLKVGDVLKIRAVVTEKFFKETADSPDYVKNFEIASLVFSVKLTEMQVAEDNGGANNTTILIDKDSSIMYNPLAKEVFEYNSIADTVDGKYVLSENGLIKYVPASGTAQANVVYYKFAQYSFRSDDSDLVRTAILKGGIFYKKHNGDDFYTLNNDDYSDAYTYYTLEKKGYLTAGTGLSGYSVVSQFDSYKGEFDVLTLRVQLSPDRDKNSYSFSAVLFDNETGRLELKFYGGSGKRCYLEFTDYSSSETSTQEVDTEKLPDLFDGKGHDLIIYLDRVGYLTEITHAASSTDVIENEYFILSSGRETYIDGMTYYTKTAYTSLGSKVRLVDDEGEPLYYEKTEDGRYIVPGTLFAQSGTTYYTFALAGSVTSAAFSSGEYYRNVMEQFFVANNGEDYNSGAFYFTAEEINLAQGAMLFETNGRPKYFAYDSETGLYYTPDVLYAPAAGKYYVFTQVFTDEDMPAAEKQAALEVGDYYKFYQTTTVVVANGYSASATYYTMTSHGTLSPNTEVINVKGEILYYVQNEQGRFVAPAAKLSSIGVTYYRFELVKVPSALDMQKGMQQGIVYYVKLGHNVRFTVTAEDITATHKYYVYMQIDNNTVYAADGIGNNSIGKVVLSFAGGNYTYKRIYNGEETLSIDVITDRTLFIQDGVLQKGTAGITYENAHPILSRYTLSERKAVVVTDSRMSNYFLRNVVLFPSTRDSLHNAYLVSTQTSEEMLTMIASATNSVLYYSVSGSENFKDGYSSVKAPSSSTYVIRNSQTSYYSFATGITYIDNTLSNMKYGLYRISIPMEFHFGNNDSVSRTWMSYELLISDARRRTDTEYYLYNTVDKDIELNLTQTPFVPTASAPSRIVASSSDMQYYFNVKKYVSPDTSDSREGVTYCTFAIDDSVKSDIDLAGGTYYRRIENGSKPYYVRNSDPYNASYTYYTMKSRTDSLPVGTKLYSGNTPMYFVDDNADMTATRSSKFVFEASFNEKESSTLWIYLGVSSPRIFEISSDTHPNMANEHGAAIRVTSDSMGNTQTTLYMAFVDSEGSSHIFSKVYDIDSICWSGRRNILQVDYLPDDGLMAIRLYQYYLAENGSYVTEFAWQEFVRDSLFADISRNDIQAAIRSMNYVGYGAKSLVLTLFDQTITEGNKTDYDFTEFDFTSSSDDLFGQGVYHSGLEKMQTTASSAMNGNYLSFLATGDGKQYVLSDSYGVPYAYSGNTIRMTFSMEDRTMQVAPEERIGANDFFWYFGSTSPYASGISASDRLQMRQRGLMLRSMHGNYTFDFYKYNMDYRAQNLNLPYTKVTLDHYTVQATDQYYELKEYSDGKTYYSKLTEGTIVTSGAGKEYYKRFDFADGQTHSLTVMVTDDVFMYNYETNPEEQARYATYEDGFVNYASTVKYNGTALKELLTQTTEMPTESDSKQWAMQLASDLCKNGNKGFRLVFITIDDSVTTVCVCPNENNLQTVTDDSGNANADLENSVGRDIYFMDGVYYTGLRMSSPMKVYELITYTTK